MVDYNMESFSLLFPENANKSYKTLTDEAINDLSIDFILDALTEESYEKNLIRRLLVRITDDKDVISYRRDVFDDFLRHPELREKLSELVVKLADLRDIERFQKDQEASSLWQLINRLREIDEYVNCITSIKDILQSVDIQSEGMKQLRQNVIDIYNESGFDELKKDIAETFEKARKLRSVTIGVNLDNLLRPKSAGVVSLNDEEFGRPGIMKNFFRFTDSKDDMHHGTDTSKLTNFHPSNMTASHVINAMNVMKSGVNGVPQTAHYVNLANSGATGEDPLSDAIKRCVTDILKRTVKDIKFTLKKYINISGYAIINLLPEILFYIRWAELVDKITALGMPMCKAEIGDASERNCSIKEIYNLKLAIKNVQGDNIDIIRNDVDFDDEHRIYILTGPNRGGKTIFTQAVGIAMLMAQCGIFVPARSAYICPCDNIFTHFPADENETVDLGRLGEESQRLAGIFEEATEKSFILLNESFATTNVAEGLFIANDVVKAMRYIGTRTIFNTHMHELARKVDEINTFTDGKSKVASMITGVHDGQRSFKVILAPPQGVSYARDIAQRYGVTFEQIKKSIEQK